MVEEQMTKLATNNIAMSCKLSNGERDDPLGSDQDKSQQDVFVDVSYVHSSEVASVQQA